MSGYSEVSYWDDRYRVDVESLEWYQPFSTLRPFIAPLLVIHPAQLPADPSTSSPNFPSRDLRRNRSSSVTSSIASPNPPHRSSVVPLLQRSSINSSSPLIPLRSLSSTPQAPGRLLPRGRANTHDGPPPLPSPAHFSSPPPLPRIASVTDRLRVLVLGCGFSSTALDVWRMAEGRAEVVAIDFSIQCIEECRRRYPSTPNLSFHCGDFRALDFPPDHFDLLIDKAALDCLHCAEGGEGREVKAAVAGLHRVLKVDGALLSLSHSPPDQRVACFALEQLDVWKEALVQDKREKERQRAGQRESPAPGSRRASILVNQVAALQPTPSFSQPVVHRIAKLQQTRPTTVSVTKVKGEEGEEGEWKAGGEEEEEGLSLDAMEEAEHYLYIVRKEANGDLARLG